MKDLVLVFLTSFFVVLLSIPALIRVAVLKRLVDAPDGSRKLHKRHIPTIGGIMIFGGTLFAFSLWYPGYGVKTLQYITACGLILFFVGVKDDIIGTAAVKKLIAHIIVSFILVLLADVRITSLHGFFGIREIPDWASISLSVFAYIVIVNSINLIDGIDGLAGGIGLLTSTLFAVWFFLAGDIVMATLGVALAGSLLAFLNFNFSPAKIFMGDSGSLTIGFFLSIMSIKMIEFRVSHLDGILVDISKPLLALAFLSFPLVDTFRIFFYRTIRGISPFTPDKNHIHHRLLALGFNQKQTVLIILGFSLLMVALAVVMKDIPATYAFLIIAGIALALTQIPFVISRYREKRMK